jgi:hypothetical protein
MAVGLGRSRGWRPRRAGPPDGGPADRDHLTSLGGLAALSLDALSSVRTGRRRSSSS